MKILILSTSEFGIAPNRTYKALRKSHIDAKMLVRDKVSDDINVHSINTSWIIKKVNFLRFVWERVVILINNHFNRSDLFKVSIANTGTNIQSHLLVKDADIIHLHWINQGFLSLKDIQALVKTGKPIVWTMHDQWSYTGICHYTSGCDRFTDTCSYCPKLKNPGKRDLSYKMFKRKMRLYQSNAFTFVGCSRWIAMCEMLTMIPGS